MSTARPLLSLFVIILFLSQVGSYPSAIPDDEQFAFLFEGFELRAMDTLPRDIPFVVLDPFTLLNRDTFQNGIPPEARLVPGRVYSFRKTATTSNESLSINVLPERLVRIGARVTQAPRSSADLTYVFIGGPLYSIRFVQGDSEGWILNRPHIVQNGGSWEEVVLALRKRY